MRWLTQAQDVTPIQHIDGQHEKAAGDHVAQREHDGGSVVVGDAAGARTLEFGAASRALRITHSKCAEVRLPLSTR
jgi:hypothetical protein